MTNPQLAAISSRQRPPRVRVHRIGSQCRAKKGRAAGRVREGPEPRRTPALFHRAGARRGRPLEPPEEEQVVGVEGEAPVVGLGLLDDLIALLERVLLDVTADDGVLVADVAADDVVAVGLGREDLDAVVGRVLALEGVVVGLEVEQEATAVALDGVWAIAGAAATSTIANIAARIMSLRITSLLTFVDNPRRGSRALRSAQINLVLARLGY